MTNIEKIKAEMERRKKRWMYDDLPIAMGRYYEDRDILSFIDSLPEEKHSEDLEEVAARYERESRQSILSSVDIVDAFIAGAEWQKEQKPAEWSEEDEKDMAHPYDKGLQDGKAEAMADLERTYFCNPDKLPKWLKDDIARKELNAHTKGYNKGYKDAKKRYNESVAYHYPDSIPPGIAYKSPKCYTDVMITPNTHSGTSTLKAEG